MKIQYNNYSNSLHMNNILNSLIINLQSNKQTQYQNYFNQNKQTQQFIKITKQKISFRLQFLLISHNMKSKQNNINNKVIKQSNKQFKQSNKFFKQQTQGIPNVGNTCFINAIINSLYSLKSFQQHIGQINTNNKLIICLQQIFSSIRNFKHIFDKAQLMKKFTYLLSHNINDYCQNSQQDALKFFIDISNVMQQAFTSQLFFISYQKICQNQLTNKSHLNQRIYSFNQQMFLGGFEQLCQQCTIEQSKIINKYPYLTKNIPKNIITFGQDYTSLLSRSKFDIIRPSFYMLYYKQNKQDPHLSYKVLKYCLKARTLYKGNYQTGHYIALRKKTIAQYMIIKGQTKRLLKSSQNYYMFDDQKMIDLNKVQNEKQFRTKFTIYQLQSDQKDIQQFRALYEKYYKQMNQNKVKQRGQNSKLNKQIEQKRKNMQQVLRLYNTLHELKQRLRQQKKQSLISEKTNNQQLALNNNNKNIIILNQQQKQDDINRVQMRNQTQIKNSQYQNYSIYIKQSSTNKYNTNIKHQTNLQHQQTHSPNTQLTNISQQSVLPKFYNSQPNPQIHSFNPVIAQISTNNTQSSVDSNNQGQLLNPSCDQLDKTNSCFMKLLICCYSDCYPCCCCFGSCVQKTKPSNNKIKITQNIRHSNKSFAPYEQEKYKQPKGNQQLSPNKQLQFKQQNDNKSPRKLINFNYNDSLLRTTFQSKGQFVRLHNEQMLKNKQIQLHDIFRFFKQQRKTKYYRTNFQSIWDILNKQQLIQKLIKSKNIKLFRSNYILKQIHIYQTVISLDDLIYYEIKYDQIPLQINKKQSYNYNKKQQNLQNLYKKITVKWMPSQQYLKKTIYLTYLRSKPNINSNKKQTIDNLLTNSKLNHQFKQHKDIQFTTHKPPYQIKSYINQQNQQNNKFATLNQEKQSIIHIYSKIMSQIIRNCQKMKSST